MNILKTIASKIGMDKSIAYSSGANNLITLKSATYRV